MNNDLVWHYGLGGGHLFRKLIWGNTLIDKKNQCCHGSVLSVLQALTTFSTTSVTSSPHIWFFTLLTICFWKISLALSKQPTKIDINTWNWSSKSHSRTTPEVFLVFRCISSLGIACKSRNISHFRISNRPTERWNLFILCHKEANLIFLEVNFVQLWITICIIFLSQKYSNFKDVIFFQLEMQHQKGDCN